jgi:hypothetical protein
MIVLLLYQTHLKDALAHLAPCISDLNVGLVQWSRRWKYGSFSRRYTNFKKFLYKQVFHRDLPYLLNLVVSSKYRQFTQFCCVNIFSTTYNRNLLLLDDPGRVRIQTISVVRQIQRFDFDCNLLLTQKLIIRIPAGLALWSSLIILSQEYLASQRQKFT